MIVEHNNPKAEQQIGYHDSPYVSTQELAHVEDHNNDSTNVVNESANQNFHEQPHISSGQYLKSAVYGGTDGVINCLAVIIGGIASGSPPLQVISVGLSVVIGDGVGMGLGDYLSGKAEKQFIQSEQDRELYEVDNMLQEEISEIKHIYQQKGYNQEQSQRIGQLYSTNRQAFANIMMMHELGLVVDDAYNPMINGIVNFIAFVTFGFIPLIPYFVSYYGRNDHQSHFLWTMAIGGVELFILGFAKSTLIGMKMVKRFYHGAQSVLLAAVAVAAGYGIGKIFDNIRSLYMNLNYKKDNILLFLNINKSIENLIKYKI